MCKDLKIVKELCYVSKSEEQILKGNKKTYFNFKEKKVQIYCQIT